MKNKPVEIDKSNATRVQIAWDWNTKHRKQLTEGAQAI